MMGTDRSRLLLFATLAAAVLAPGLVQADLRRTLHNAPALVELDPAGFGPGYRNAADALIATAARALPVPASGGAFTYRFDPATGTYEKTNATFGPMLFMERPQTIGRYVWNIGVTGQYLELDEFDGESIGRDLNPVIPPGRTVTFLATPKFIYHLATVNVTYGLLDDLDLNVAVPLASTDSDTNASLIDENGSFFFNTEHSQVSLGVGDIQVRAKYRICEWQGITTAAGAVWRIPSGDEDDALGTGDFELGPYVAMSALYWNRVEPQWNAGFDVNLNDSHLSSAHYAFGVNVQAVKEWLDLGVSFLGRSEIDSRREQSAISGPHLTDAGAAQTPYFALDLERNDYFDAAVGARVRLYKTLVFSLNMLKGLNDEGIRSSSWSPVGALEATF
jgi:hypothetical protein